jgi:hypothetical protein
VNSKEENLRFLSKFRPRIWPQQESTRVLVSAGDGVFVDILKLELPETCS